MNGVAYSHHQTGKRRKADETRCILRGIDLTVESGEMVAVAGKSGSGKSTFLQLIKGFYRPSAGTLKLDGVDPHGSKRPELFDRIGYVFQYPEHQLFAPTVAEDVGFGLRHAGFAPDEKEAKIRSALGAVGLSPGAFASRSPLELSGGEKRRVALAGVLVLEPEVLILDEPTAGLDLPSRRALFELLHRLRRERGMTVIWVSHQLEEMLAHGERLLALNGGAFVADGRPSDVLSDAGLLDLFGWREPAPLALRRWLARSGGETVPRPWDADEWADAYLRSVSKTPGFAEKGWAHGG